jgi:acetolactate synthase I/II/III large subunit
MKLNGADIIIKFFQERGISEIPGIPGGSNLPLYDSLSRSSIRHILARHEQGAGFIAQGIARSTGEVAVCFATSGPGATNLVTAIADAWADSVPVMFITGQVPGAYIGTDAFQEVNFCDMTRTITKGTYLVRQAEDLFTILPEAYELCNSARPGPVFIDVPKDVQQQVVELKTFHFRKNSALHNEQESNRKSEKIAEAINHSQRPIFYIGGGCVSSNAHREIQSVARKNSIPVVNSLMGLGCFPQTSPLYIGMLGMHGAKHANLLLNDADLIIAAGARFDDRATGKLDKFCPQAKVIHIDIDPKEINKLRRADISIVADLKTVIRKIEPMIEKNQREKWITYVHEVKIRHMPEKNKQDNVLAPDTFLRELSVLTDHDSIVTTDVGQHQMWVAQYYPFTAPRTFLTSGGLGTMGFGFPAAIGAAVANPKKQVICVTGDGSFFMNMQELATLAELNLNVKIILFNNQSLGLVRQQQELFYKGNFFASCFEAQTNFSALAEIFGIPSVNLAETSDPVNSLEKALETRGPYLIEVPVNKTKKVFPMVPPGAANHEMLTA